MCRMSKKVVVIGGGPAGMMASYAAAINGADVTLLEKNEKTGKKLFITGKGRCNLTNNCDSRVFFDNVVSNPKFMYSSYNGFDNGDLMRLVSKHCPLKTERGNRVFPVSDHSSDVIKALNALLWESGVKVFCNAKANRIQNDLVDSDAGRFPFDALVIATGGLSYPQTGSTGDGYIFARQLGHSVIQTRPALTGLSCKEKDCAELQGLSLKNVEFTLKADVNDKKSIYSERGEMLFAHYGISGPLILSASSYYAQKCFGKKAFANIDLKPALDIEKLDERILRDFNKYNNRDIKNAMADLLPSGLIPTIIKRSGVDKDKKVNLITSSERHAILETLKSFKLTVTGLRPFEEAVITQGGIDTKQVNPSTMGSKLCKNVFFAGEILDVDALTGGFNLQIAFSTGYLAGKSAATVTD